MQVMIECVNAALDGLLGNEIALALESQLAGLSGVLNTNAAAALTSVSCWLAFGKALARLDTFSVGFATADASIPLDNGVNVAVTEMVIANVPQILNEV